MQQAIKELRESIGYHRKRLSRINLMMWLLIVLSAVIYFLIYVMLDVQINKILFSFQLAVENGYKPDVDGPGDVARASSEDRLGLIILSMCAARLLVYFGELRFHMRELSKQEKNMLMLIMVEAAQNPELLEPVRAALLRSSDNPSSPQEPSLHLPSEAIAKISDAVVDRLSKALSSQRG